MCVEDGSGKRFIFFPSFKWKEKLLHMTSLLRVVHLKIIHISVLTHSFHAFNTKIQFYRLLCVHIATAKIQAHDNKHWFKSFVLSIFITYMPIRRFLDRNDSVCKYVYESFGVCFGFLLFEFHLIFSILGALCDLTVFRCKRAHLFRIYCFSIVENIQVC